MRIFRGARLVFIPRGASGGIWYRFLRLLRGVLLAGALGIGPAGAADEFVWRPDSPIKDIASPGLVASHAAAADFTGDGLTDLAVTYAFSEQVRLYRGDGEGGFSEYGQLEVGIHEGAGRDLPRQIVIEDFDADGFLDLAILCSGNPDVHAPPSLGICHGAPRGLFEPFEPIELLAENTAADSFPLVLRGARLAGDDAPSLLVGHFDSAQFTVIRHLRGRQWRKPVTFQVDARGAGPADLEPVDLDFDGLTDLIVLNRRDIQFWQGDADGRFGYRGRLEAEFANAAFTAMAPADFDRNGAWDLVVLDGAHSRLLLYLNLAFDADFERRLVYPFTGDIASTNHREGPIDLVLHDANQDGWDDVAVAFLQSGGGSRLLGRADGAPDPLRLPPLDFGTGPGPRAILSAHIDADGLPDLVTVNEGAAGEAQHDITVDLAIHGVGGPAPQTGLNAQAPGRGISPYLDRPVGLAWDEERDALWLMDRRRRRLVRLDDDGELQSELPLDSANQAGPLDPMDLTVDPAGELWLADRLGAQVVHLRAHGERAGGFSTLAAGLTRPSGIAHAASPFRLYVSDAASRRLVAFDAAGAVIQTWERAPMRDLAWDAEHGILWGVPEAEPQVLINLGIASDDDDDDDKTDQPAQLALHEVAPLLKQERIRAIAFGEEGPWILTERGALIETDDDGELESIRELRLLRDIAAAAPADAGGLWLIDSGLLATLVRIDAGGAVQSRHQLNHPAMSDPIRPLGLARRNERLYLLDGRNGQVRPVEGDRLDAPPVALLPMPPRPSGLCYDESTDSFYSVAPGRLIQLQPLGPEDGAALASDAVVSWYPLPATHPPSSLTRGREPGELMIYSADRPSVMFLDLQAPGVRLITPLLLNLVDFVPRIVLAEEAAAGVWRLVGSGDEPVQEIRIPTVTSALESGWTRYR